MGVGMGNVAMIHVLFVPCAVDEGMYDPFCFDTL
jgi:hypothetical protein